MESSHSVCIRLSVFSSEVWHRTWGLGGNGQPEQQDQGKESAGEVGHAGAGVADSLVRRKGTIHTLASTYSHSVVGSGIGKPSSRNPSR